MTALNGWQNFYVIAGSSAGALIGLQFVVMALIAGMPITRNEARAGDSFATPTVVHFGAVLLLSAVVSAPWDGIAAVAVLWGLVGLGGVVYVLLVARRLRRQTAYRAVFEDWLFHVLLPFTAYANDDSTALVVARTSSGAEELARMIPKARVVAAFQTVPSEVLFGVYEARYKASRPSLVYVGPRDLATVSACASA